MSASGPSGPLVLKIDHEIISTAIFLSSADSRRAVSYNPK